MNKPVIFTTPSGDRMAVIPLEEYERLVEAAEDAADIRAYDEIKAKIASGEEELVPAEIANRILNGENKIRVWREYRGLAVGDLARAAGVSSAFISQLEGGARSGSTETLRKIASVLRVSLDELASA